MLFCNTDSPNFRSSLFWYVTQRRLVVSYRRFGKTYRSHLQGSSTPDLTVLLYHYFYIQSAATIKAFTTSWNEVSLFPVGRRPCTVLSAIVLHVFLHQTSIFKFVVAKILLQRCKHKIITRRQIPRHRPNHNQFIFFS